MYEVTVRYRGEKIVRRIDVDNLETTLSEIIEMGYQPAERRLKAFRHKYPRASIHYFWFPELIPELPPPPPKPEPIGFDVLVNQWSV